MSAAKRFKAINIFLGIVICSTVFNNLLIIVKDVGRLKTHHENSVIRKEERLRPVLDFLPHQTTVEYKSDESDIIESGALFMMQYILAPNIVSPDQRSRYVIVDCKDPLKRDEIIRKENLTLTLDIDDKLALCQRRPD